MSNRVIQLKCNCNNYPWGKPGKESAAARLCEKTPGTDFKIDESKEYAEMWMGTYPTTPAYVLSTGELLQDVLNKNKEELIGKNVIAKYGTDLPFLPKILSIAKALPLQLHPNKDLASKLHQKDPDQFGDANHKPEIAVAFTKFEVFAGFKPIEDIQFLASLPAVKENLTSFNPSASKWDTSTVRSYCHALLTAPESTVEKISSSLQQTPPEKLSSQFHIQQLLPRLQSQYGNTDNGNLVALLAMNFMTLSPGEALYIPADGIHAYLAGDIFECMARSDNVLNVGFCPPADRNNVDTFTGTLTFKSTGKDDMLLPSKTSPLGKKGKTVVYAPPMSEFNLLVTTLQKKGDVEVLDEINGPSIMIVISGEAKMKVGGGGGGVAKEEAVKEGYIFYVGQGVELEFESMGEGDFVAYRAYAD